MHAPFCNNVALNYIANRKYPFLRNKIVSKNLFDKRGLLINIKSTFMYKIAVVILSNTDNILISMVVGTVYVGYYSNYYMIVSYITAFITIFINGIIASLGNLNAENNSETSYRMFNALSLIFSFIGAFVACCLLNCMQSFIPVWIGAENVMPFSWVIVIVLNNYISQLMNPVWMFRETMGLFRQVRYLMLITAALNLVLSVLLGKLWGVPGILIATVLSKLISQYWYEPMLLFRSKFKKNVKPYFISQLKQVIAVLVAAGVSYFICQFVWDNIIGMVIRAVISGATAVVVVLLFNYKSDAWNTLYSQYIKNIIYKFINIRGKS